MAVCCGAFVLLHLIEPLAREAAAALDLQRFFAPAISMSDPAAPLWMAAVYGCLLVWGRRKKTPGQSQETDQPQSETGRSDTP